MKRALSRVMGLVVALVALQAGHGVLMRLGEDPNAAQRIAWTEGTCTGSAPFSEGVSKCSSSRGPQ